MGLISDYLEENRERLDCFDPCIPLKSYFQQRSVRESIWASLHAYDKSHEEQARKMAQQRLLVQLADLERLIGEYLAGEKYILYICNGNKLKSSLVQEIFEQLQEEIQKSYYGTCDLRQEIVKKLGGEIQRQENGGSHAMEKEIVGLVINSVVICLGQNGTVLNTAQCRNIVYDLGNLLIDQGMGKGQVAPKEVLADYLESERLVEVGSKYCCNCGRPLYKELGYCLNCYERN